MIHTEIITIDGAEYQRTWADSGAVQNIVTGETYNDAIDPLDSGRTYIEVDCEDEASAEDIIKILTGYED